MATSWTIEGIWTGYTSAQRHVVHREHTRSKKRVEAVRKLGAILYTDGTRLLLDIREGKNGAAIAGYTDLINSCISEGVSSVAALK